MLLFYRGRDEVYDGGDFFAKILMIRAAAAGDTAQAALLPDRYTIGSARNYPPFSYGLYV